MPKKIPRNFDQDAPNSAIRKAQRKETEKQKGSGGIVNETKEYIKELKSKRRISRGKK
jgi:hypothetical protein